VCTVFSEPSSQKVQHQHRIYVPVLGESHLVCKPSAGELGMVLDSLLASRALLMEEGAVTARRSEDDRKEVGGTRWKNALSV
jgi:origin recognition complex subunit 1